MSSNRRITSDVADPVTLQLEVQDGGSPAGGGPGGLSFASLTWPGILLVMLFDPVLMLVFELV